MGNCLTVSSASDVSKKRKALPIESLFKLPAPVPIWPPGEGFASGSIDLGGGLEVCQISSFSKVWATFEGGPDNQGATFFEPSPLVLPEEFCMLGCYSQPNNKPLSGWVLAGKDNTNDPQLGLVEALKKPIDYTLVWSSESLKIKKQNNGYFWLPTPPDGYKAVGHVITNSPEKPSLDKIRCVRSDLTDLCEADTWIWGPDNEANPNGFNVHGLQPSDRGAGAPAVSVGTFVAQSQNINGGGAAANISLACLKNISSNSSSAMPNLAQVDALVQAYSPRVYLHPDEQYLPSSVSWFFQNGALLYQRAGEEEEDQEPKPVNIDPTGSNLPQGGANDDAYWLDLPLDEKAKETVKKGNLQDSMTYMHIKPMLGATFTDIAVWIFYPFNGPARAKVEFVNISLGKIGQHVGDWEHVTLRVSNFNGELMKVFLSEHSSGTWVNASELEFLINGGNHVVSYASLHGHAFYPKPGLVLQGSGGIGIRNDTAKSKLVLDTGARYSVVAAEYLGSSAVVEPQWLNYYRKWGPKITYDLATEIKDIEKLLPGKLKAAFEKLVKSLPNEVLGEEGPTGPKLKKNWNGDEV